MNELKKIEVTPISAESLGVRSMAVLIKTPDISIIIDPGCALGPNRYRLLPHPLEYKKLFEMTNKLINLSKMADVLIISHFHHDHFKPKITDYFTIYTNPEIFESLYVNKRIFIKNPEIGCSRNSQIRGKKFMRDAQKIAISVHLADRTKFNFGDTEISFSRAVFHGESNAKQGKVIMTRIKYFDESILHASDVQGPILTDTARIITKLNPNLAIIGGPPIYLQAFQKQLANKINSIKNMVDIIKSIPRVLYDHHLLRKIDWKEECFKIFNNLNVKIDKIDTFASFLSIKEELLEANREKLYEEFPITEEFKKWQLLNEKIRKSIRPPLDS